MAEEDATKKAASGKRRQYADNILPMARIKKIMKMDPSITDNITLEANYLMCAATELFIRHLAKEVYEMDKRCLSYQNLSKYIQKDDRLDFLHDVVPEKITVREYKKILSEEKERNVDDVSNSEDSSTEEESSSDSEEESDASGEEEDEDVEMK